MAEEPVLTYFEGRGLGELIRITLCLAKIPFKQRFLTTREDFLNLDKDGKLFFHQLPLLEMDGMNLVQSTATLRYIAEKGNMVPQDPKDKFRVDMLFDGARDASFPQLRVCMPGNPEDPKPSIQAALDKYLPKYEEVLQASSTGCLVGSFITLADAALLNLLMGVHDYLGDAAFNSYPAIQSYYKDMLKRPEIDGYIKNYRQRPNDERYIQTINTVLAR